MVSRADRAMTQLDPATLPGRRVLVIAPHPDDESLGCGGLIALLCRDGRTIHTVFVTDGGASHLHSPTWTRARLAAQRQAEAVEALRRLGAGSQPRTFLRLPDAAMPAPGSPERDAAVDALARIVADLSPDLVVLPWRRDPHCDHRDSWHLAHDALRRAGVFPAVLEYAIWLDELGAPADHPLPGEADAVFVRIDAVRDEKRSAVAAHLSQTGALIDDDPDAFRLTATTVDRLTGPCERFWRPLP